MVLALNNGPTLNSEVWQYVNLLKPNDIYRVSQEERVKLREGVPYVKLYRYNPKHLYPKLNGYGNNGHREVWTSGVSTYCTPSVTPFSSTAHARQKDIVMQWPWRMLYSTVALTSQDNNQLRPAWSTWKPKDKYDSIASVFVVQFNGFMSQVTLMLSTGINITETTYSCQFQYEFGNQ